MDISCTLVWFAPLNIWLMAQTSTLVRNTLLVIHPANILSYTIYTISLLIQ